MIKTHETDWIRSRIGIQPKMLDSDPVQVNTVLTYLSRSVEDTSVGGVGRHLLVVLPAGIVRLAFHLFIVGQLCAFILLSACLVLSASHSQYGSETLIKRIDLVSLHGMNGSYFTVSDPISLNQGSRIQALMNKDPVRSRM